MKSAIKDVPVSFEIPEAISREVKWGDMTVNAVEVRETIDIAPLLKGLPDDGCQCPHWGYVIRGQIHVKFGEIEEIYQSGDLYYMSPSHTVVYEAGTEYIEFSPTVELEKTMEVVASNMQSMSK